MDSRRTSRVIDPMIRKVGFFAPGPPPDRTQSSHVVPSSGNSLSPVMIPPPRHASDNLSSAVGVPVPSSQLSRHSIDNLQVESYNPPDSVLGTSPLRSPSSRIGDGEFSEDSVNWIRRSNSGKFASSLPNGGYNKTQPSGSKKVHGDFVDEKAGGPVEKEPVFATSSKPLKDKTTKAERRAMQEAQRAAKAAAKGSKSSGSSGIGGTFGIPTGVSITAGNRS